MVAPDNMPEHLIWHKWQSYSTWLSGAALLMIVYWMGAELYLIDPAKADLAVWQAVLISAGSLGIGWLCYDLLCKSSLGNAPTTLMVILFVILVVMSWGYHQIFTGRAALLHLGAFTATIMTANVFFIIMPNQRIVVKDLIEGRTPDAKYGKIAKLRSTHNNYLTLPVIFLMLSIHYPLAFATQYSWLIAGLVFLMGVTIRHYFNSMHARAGKPTWTWAVTVILFILIAWLSSIPIYDEDDLETAETRRLTPLEQQFVDVAEFDAAHDIVLGRCSMCHARDPVWDGIRWAPGGVLLETRADIAKNAREIYLQAGISHAMPPANITELPSADRRMIVSWYKAATKLTSQ
jgi:uncharacterized membrane protein